MKECKLTWKQSALHCPNCGGLVSGSRNIEGQIRFQCYLCGVRIVLKQMGRRHDRIDVYARDGQVRHE